MAGTLNLWFKEVPGVALTLNHAMTSRRGFQILGDGPKAEILAKLALQSRPTAALLLGWLPA